jgi:hypothetical protein
MAWETGVASDLDDLLDKMCTFAVAEGGIHGDYSNRIDRSAIRYVYSPTRVDILVVFG